MFYVINIENGQDFGSPSARQGKGMYNKIVIVFWLYMENNLYTGYHLVFYSYIHIIGVS